MNDWKAIRLAFTVPMRLMGQTWEEPLGPDGWPEDDSEMDHATALCRAGGLGNERAAGTSG